VAKNGKRYIVGIDTGGTFTDIVVMDIETAECIISKSPTTPYDFSEGVMEGIARAAELMNLSRKDLLQQCLMVKHGTTVGTNAVITGTGAKVGFLTTKGFEDTTLIGRAIQRVDGLSSDEIRKMPSVVKPKPLVPKSQIRGVFERIDFRGNVVIPLNLEDAKKQISYLIAEEGVDAIGISLLFSFLNPVHEQKIEELINRMYPDHNLYITTAHSLTPIQKEYGRANTVILNSFIGKVMDSYLFGLHEKLQKESFEGRFLVMQSNGGTMSWEKVPPIRTLSSGPSGGVIGSAFLSDLLKHPNIISADMGGTSFDVSVIREGMWSYEREPIVSRWRLMLPMIKCESIGAGGGTIARVEPITKRLIVGPQSAGSQPGPICYDQGGKEPTVCDADLVLGFLNPDYFLGGKMKLNKAKAEQAIHDKIAVQLNMSILEAAAGIFTIINSHMADVIRVSVMSVGLVPSDLIIYAFGGTGPVHAAYFASELGAKQVYVFPASSVFSAFGITGSDIIQTKSFSLGYSMPANPDTLTNRISEFREPLLEEMEEQGLARSEIAFRYLFNMRYKRQVNYHTVALPGKEYTNKKEVDEVLDSWIDSFESIYGKGVTYTKAGIELVSMDIDAVYRVTKPSIKTYQPANSNSSAAIKAHREVLFPGLSEDHLDTPIYEYERLEPNNVVTGPAIVESPTSTIVVPPEWAAFVDSYLGLTLKKD
jgi:N-methylhydantoinase A